MEARIAEQLFLIPIEHYESFLKLRHDCFNKLDKPIDGPDVESIDDMIEKGREIERKIEHERALNFLSNLMSEIRNFNREYGFPSRWETSFTADRFNGAGAANPAGLLVSSPIYPTGSVTEIIDLLDSPGGSLTTINPLVHTVGPSAHLPVHLPVNPFGLLDGSGSPMTLDIPDQYSDPNYLGCWCSHCIFLHSHRFLRSHRPLQI
jgi:hypothetical protein